MTPFFDSLRISAPLRLCVKNNGWESDERKRDEAEKRAKATAMREVKR